MMSKAIVLLSGGLDSATVLALATQEYYECYALSFNYGQKHSSELEAAKKLAQFYKVREHCIFEMDFRRFGGSALTDDVISVPQPEQNRAEIPVTYVPARNTVFLSVALGWAEVLKAFDIFIGVNAIDYSGYPDCRPEFIEAYERMANLATKEGVEGNKFRIQTPLIHQSKSEIIQLGSGLGVDYSLTVSCYNADSEGRACGKCDACYLRAKGFRDAGLTDPTFYQD